MEQKHSPLSWRLTSQMNRFSVKSHNELFIASDIRQLDDAQFIVHACNNFEELLKACKLATYYLAMITDCNLGQLRPSAENAYKHIEAAIAKAEAKGGDV